MLSIIIFSVLSVFAILIGLSGIRVVRPTERGLIERLGKYRKFAEPGFHFIIPLMEHMIYVNITENMVESGKREMITNDNLNATIDALIFYKVKADENSVKQSEYNVAAYEDQIVALTKTALRNIIGTMTLKEANSERNKINVDLLTLLSKETATWGIEVVRAELKEIDPPADVQATMNQVVKASNAKVAAVDFATAQETEADGSRRAAIKAAEGRKQAEILEAEGNAQAMILNANARAEALKTVNEAAAKYFTGEAKELRKIEALEKSLAGATKVVIPSNGSLVNVIGDLIK